MSEPMTFAEQLAAARAKRAAAVVEAAQSREMSVEEKERLALAQRALCAEIERGGKSGAWLDVMMVRQSDFRGGAIVQGAISDLDTLSRNTVVCAFVEECLAQDLQCYVYLQIHTIGNDGYWLKVMLP